MAIQYTKGEERTNTWSHAGGAVLGILIGVLMLQVCWQAGSRWAVFGVSLYLFGMLSSYLCSAIYHGLPARSVWKERLRRFDSCRHLLAHCRQLFASGAHCVA